ncbi:MAG: hypothetical protein L6262_09120 [Weeksellaceae bacterium]|nr:hypothetical protein [Weeksellaceae bacterium]
MIKKIIIVLINIVLVLIPFFPITEDFFPAPVGNSDFVAYLLSCFGISVLMILLMLIIKKDLFTGFYNLKSTALLLFFLGMLVMIPLHLGPPRIDEAIFPSVHIEKTRYALLIVAVLIFFTSIPLFLKKYWSILKRFDKLIVVPIIICLPILLWDNYDSFMISEKLKDWISSGKSGKDFFEQFVGARKYWHTTGRLLTYVSIIWFAVILMHHSFIKKWKGIVIGVFGIIGIVFCFLFLFVDNNFYFPFMIPAIVMAPAYWLGLSLLNEKPNP